jgi:hypothetical protein
MRGLSVGPLVSSAKQSAQSSYFFGKPLQQSGQETPVSPATAGSWAEGEASAGWLGGPIGMTLAAAFSLRRSKTRSRKHSTGTEYTRSVAENFVANEMITCLPSGEKSSALNAITLIGFLSA